MCRLVFVNFLFTVVLNFGISDELLQELSFLVFAIPVSCTGLIIPVDILHFSMFE